MMNYGLGSAPFMPNYTPPRAQSTAPPPAVRNSFEDPTQMVHYTQTSSHTYNTVQQSPSQPQQANDGYATQPATMSYPSATSYGGSPQYQPQPQQMQQQYAPQDHQQQQQYAPQQEQQPWQMQQQQQQRNALCIQMHQITLGSSDNKSNIFDQPDVPRLTPEDVEADLARRAPAAPYIEPVKRVFVRPTFDLFPATPEVANALQLPLAMHIRPFAEPALPEVDFTKVDNSMVRCRNCQAYISPFTTFVNNGAQWQCIFCRTINTVSKNYYCPLDLRTGLREDLAHRAELSNCSVDFYATKEFLRRPPQRPVLLVMLDCTHPAVNSGLLRAMCEGALQALERMRDDDTMHMGVIGFDSSVYYFNLRSTLTGPVMMAAPDTVHDIRAMNDNFRLDPVELPCALRDLIVPIKDSYVLLRELFEKLPTMFAETTEVGCAFGPAVTAALSVLSTTGGKVVASLASLPSLGDGKLKQRFDTAKMANQAKEYMMCQPANDWYKQRALICSNSGISVDLIVGSQCATVDLATIALLPRLTSGKMYYATKVNMRGIVAQVERCLTRFTAFDAILRIRTSNGLVVTNCYAHCYLRQPDLLALPISDEDTSYTVEFKLTGSGEAPVKRGFVYVQIAVVHTTRNWERRIRVHTIQIALSNSLPQIVNAADSIALAGYFSKMCVDEVQNGTTSFAEARQKVTKKWIAVLRALRKEAEKQGSHFPPAKLVLPSSMRYVPQLLNGFFRTVALSNAIATPISPDERIAFMSSVITSAPEAMLPFYLGQFYRVSGPYMDIEQLPCSMFAHPNFIRESGIYIIHVGCAILLWCGNKANAVVAQALGLNASELVSQAATQDDDAGANMVSFAPQQLAEFRARTEALIEQLRRGSQSVFSAELLICSSKTQEVVEHIFRVCSEETRQNLTSYSSFIEVLWRHVMSEQ